MSAADVIGGSASADSDVLQKEEGTATGSANDCSDGGPAISADSDVLHYQVARAAGSAPDSDVSHEDSDDDDPMQVHLKEECAAQVLATMQPTMPGVIRAVRAGRALRCCGRAFRGHRGARGRVRSPWLASFETGKIDEFWSHSWHGSPRAKVITAFFENNGRIAPLIATGCAAGAAGLFALGILPMSFQKHQASPPVPEYPFRSYWGKAVGFFVYCIVLLCWKPRKTVFLDALCINDDDDRWKCAALLSMPVFLKASDSLLVLWDETYTQRMWCCFEIASFLHAHPGKKARIRARPTLLGPCFISIPVALSFVLLSMAFIPADRAMYGSHALSWSTMAALGFVFFFWSISKLREFARSVERMQMELKGFQCEACLCYCCSVGHKDEHGQRMVCDRRALLSVICKWFGSVEDFNNLVRTEVTACLTEELSTQVLTYRNFVFMAVPVLWHHIDSASEPLDWMQRPYEGHPVDVIAEIGNVVREIFRGLGWTFGFIPILFFMASKLAHVLRGQVGPGIWRCGDILINCLILVILIALFVSVLLLEQVFWALPGVICLHLWSTVLAWLLCRCCQGSRTTKPKAEHSPIGAGPPEQAASTPDTRGLKIVRL